MKVAAHLTNNATSEEKKTKKNEKKTG